MSPDDPRYGRHRSAAGDLCGPARRCAAAGSLPATTDRGSAARRRRRTRQCHRQRAAAARRRAAGAGQSTRSRCCRRRNSRNPAPANLPPNLRRQEVSFATKEPAGTLIVDTPNTYLYYVLGNNRAIRYGVRVGRDGFTWTGVQKITRKAEWPDWHPPPEMIDRQPYLPRFMAGGPGNPLGARAMYLGNTVYRIHGTNQPSTIGKFVSSGCIGMLNEDVSDLFDRVKVGTRVVVCPAARRRATTTASAAPVPGPLRLPRHRRSAAVSVPAARSRPSVPPLPPPVTVR